MSQAVYIFFLVSLGYFFVLNFIYLGLLALSFIGSTRRLYEVRSTDMGLVGRAHLTIPISIVIPALNEERAILNSVHSALDSNYPEFEVIVVNDGSTDRTLDILKEEFDLEVRDVFYRHELPTEPLKNIYRSRSWQNLWVMDKENGGKADAVNAAANIARYRYIVSTDADSIFHKDGLLRIIRVVNRNPGLIVGIGGQLRVGNGITVEKGRITSKGLPSRLVPRFQIVEYLGSFLGNRVGWSELNSVLVVAGAFGLWRTDTFLQQGGMSTETTHEDLEYTFRLHEFFRRTKQRYFIPFIPDPIVWTEVPSTWRGIFIQRRRWQRVVVEVFWKYRRMLFNPRYGFVGMVGMPYLLIFETLGPFIEIASYIIVAILALTGTIPLALVGLFLLVSFSLTTLTRVAAIFVEQYSFRTFPISALPKLFLLAIAENFGYHQFIMAARIPAVFDVIFGNKSWERVERKGFKEEDREAA